MGFLPRFLFVVSVFVSQALLINFVNASDSEANLIQENKNYTYTISKTWDNKTTSDDEHITITFSFKNDTTGNKSMFIEVDAPYYNDPAAPPENFSTSDPVPGLWEYEIVEAFFLGDNEEYLEIELAPSGHYLLLYLKGQRNDTDRVLPLTQYETEITNTTDDPVKQRWHGEAYIPASYFPCNVTKFNAYAIHGLNLSRTYMSLFPQAEGDEKPDYHKLETFGEISFETEVNEQCENGNQDDTKRYKINRTWDNQITDDNATIFISFKQNPNDSSVEIEIDAPFYNDPAAPNASTSDPVMGLWDYEVVEAFFLGNDEEYLEIELAPSEHYLLLYLKGQRNTTDRVLPLTQYETSIVNSTDDDPENKNQRWIGKAHIPAEYFPCNVTKFNAYAIHGSNLSRTYMSLFPQPEGDQAPDFHKLETFGDISLSFGPDVKCGYKSGSISSYSPLGIFVILFTTLISFIF